MYKNWNINGYRFWHKPTYGDVDKYIKTKIKTYEDSMTTNFYNEKGPKYTRRKNTNQVFINNNARFCSLCIWKVSSSNMFRRIQI